MTPDSMFANSKILVVGTTEDYVAWLREAAPLEALYLVDAEGRNRRAPTLASSEDEIITDLSQPEGVWEALSHHLRTLRLTLSGIVCYDCEYMVLAADLSNRLHLSYPSLEAILHSRDKFLSKSIWRREGIACPMAREIKTMEEALLFFSQAEGPCVMKPLSGSGSELVFIMENEAEVRDGFLKVREGLENRAGSAMYGSEPSPPMMMERFIKGEEYSCDFVVEKDRVNILRLSRKHPYPNGPFGTTWAYVLLPISFFHGASFSLGERLGKAAAALGVDRAICMADFIVQDGAPHFLDMTPRPGGDCLPHLLKAFFGFDMLKFAFEFSRAASGPTTSPYGAIQENSYAGVRIFAEKAGSLKKIQTESVTEVFPVVDYYWKYSEGHRVAMPPEDYDSWILGHMAVRLDPAQDLFNQLLEIKKRIHVEMAPWDLMKSD